MKISSPAFEEGGPIPEKYSRQAGDLNPPLTFENVPAGAASLVLIVDDPDAPKGLFTHWVVIDINPLAPGLPESASGVRQGRNSLGESRYTGPNPPSGEHRYYFHLYALDTRLELPNGADRSQIEYRMDRHVLAEARWMGRYAAASSVLSQR